MRRSRALALVLALALALVIALVHRRADADEFWQQWGDGKAELSSYTLTQPRYGHLHAGSVVLVYVTEDFADDLRVKADPGKHPAGDVYPVLKLNVVRDFQTGIYDYNLETSTFVRTDPPSGAPWPLVKSSFSAQEWCGHVYQHWIARGGKLEGVAHSYFDGEADQAPSLDLPAGGIVEEQLPILVRGLRGEWLGPGESRTVPFLRSAMRSRLGHTKPAWGRARVTRAVEPEALETALGARRAIRYTVEEQGPGAVATTWWVEAAEPKRLLAWRGSDGEEAKIRGSARLAYWTMHDPGDEKHLAEIGLPVPKPLAPPARGSQGAKRAPLRDLESPF
jgi:hypothetical protein